MQKEEINPNTLLIVTKNIIISQTERCDIYYLLGTENLSSSVHPTLCKKLMTLDSLVGLF